jgi:hypothetical protein
VQVDATGTCSTCARRGRGADGPARPERAVGEDGCSAGGNVGLGRALFVKPPPSAQVTLSLATLSLALGWPLWSTLVAWPTRVVMQDDREMAEFQGLVRGYLLPMLPGAALDAHIHEGKNESSQFTSWVGGGVGIKLRCSLPATRHLVISRSQPFLSFEKDVATAFCREVADLRDCAGIDPARREVLLDCIPQGVVVRIAKSSAGLDDGAALLLASHLAQLRSWASQTYEGQPIASGFAIAASAARGGPHFDSYRALPAAKVLGDGLTTLWVFDPAGRAKKFLRLREPPPGRPGDFRYPQAFRKVAAWTERTRRVAACLTRRGEALLFAGGYLLAANRRGGWLITNHDAAMKRWTKVFHSQWLRPAVYATALDASFSRTGACIAVVTGQSRAAFDRAGIVKEADRPVPGTGKGAMLGALLGGLPFHALHREIRQQIVAMDGATVLGADGRIIAAGAIVSVPGGSDGGGRRSLSTSLRHLPVAFTVALQCSHEAQRAG